MSAPGYARLGTGRPGWGSVDLAASGRGAFCDDSGFSKELVGICSLEIKWRLLHEHYNTGGWSIAKRRGINLRQYTKVQRSAFCARACRIVRREMRNGAQTRVSVPQGRMNQTRGIPSLRWWIGVILFTSTVINYIDRQTLSILAPFLKQDFHW